MEDKMISTPWNDEKYSNIKNYTPNGLTKTNVDNQDNISDKLNGDNLLQSIKQVGTQTKIYKTINGIKNTVDSNLNKLGLKEVTTESLNLTNKDTIGEQIVKEKNNTYKAIDINAKLGNYNDTKNFLNIANRLFVGALGQSVSSNLEDAAKSKLGLTTGLNITNTIKNIDSFKNIDAEEIKELNTANFFNILTNKPGTKIKITNKNVRQIPDKDSGNEFVTNEQKENIKQNYRFYNPETSDTNTRLNGNKLESITEQDKLKYAQQFPENIKSEIDIKKTTGYIDGGINDFEIQNSRVKKAEVYNRVNDYFREIGGLYVEPYYSNGELTCFEIPFEFNPEISGGDMSANYESPSVMGRILPLNNYTSSTTGTITLTTSYMANAKDYSDVSINNDNFSNWGDANNPWLNGWMKDWTLNKIRITERQYRSLTLPYINGAKFVQPPIVRIKFRTLDAKRFKDVIASRELAKTNNNRDMGSEESAIKDISGDSVSGLTVGDMFKYPTVNGKIQITKMFDGETREKRYIVKNVSISPLENSFGNNYFFDVNDFKDYTGVSDGSRRGFKVTLTLQETTKNFLDLIPNSYDYLSTINETEMKNSDIVYGSNSGSSEFFEKIREAMLNFKIDSKSDNDDYLIDFENINYDTVRVDDKIFENEQQKNIFDLLYVEERK